MNHIRLLVLYFMLVSIFYVVNNSKATKLYTKGSEEFDNIISFYKQSNDINIHGEWDVHYISIYKKVNRSPKGGKGLNTLGMSSRDIDRLYFGKGGFSISFSNERNKCYPKFTDWSRLYKIGWRVYPNLTPLTDNPLFRNSCRFRRNEFIKFLNGVSAIINPSEKGYSTQTYDIEDMHVSSCDLKLMSTNLIAFECVIRHIIPEGVVTDYKSDKVPRATFYVLAKRINSRKR